MDPTDKTDPQDEFYAGFNADDAGESSTPDAQAADTPAPDTSKPAEATSAAAPAPAAPAPDVQPAASQQDDPAQELEKLRHRVRSDSNRLSAYDRKSRELQQLLQERENELRELRAKATAPAAAPAPAPAPSTGDEDDVLNQNPDLKSAIERHLASQLNPLLAKIEEQAKTIDELRGTTDKVSASVAPIVSRAEIEAKAAEAEQHQRVFDALDREVPGWEVMRETAAFKTWIETGASPATRWIFANSADPEDCVAVMSKFKTAHPDVAAAAVAAAKPRAPAAAPAPAATPAPAPRDDKTQRLRRAAGLDSRGTGSTAADMNDFSAGWNSA